MKEPLEEFRNALKDGLGKRVAELYELVPWEQMPDAAIAYSREKKMLWLMVRDTSDFHVTGDEYLDIAKKINHSFSVFVVPAQRIGPMTYWKGRKQPIVALKFSVLNEPMSGSLQ